MNYLVAVLRDRPAVEAAVAGLKAAEFPMAQVSVVGQGYRMVDEFGLIEPSKQGKQLSQLMAFWLVPFGFVAGIGFSVITNLNTFAWAGSIGNHVVGGLLGAIGGAMGGIFAGGGSVLVTGGKGLEAKGNEVMPYRQRLDEGKYLLIVRGTEPTTRKAANLLKPFEPEELEGYSER